MHPGFIEKMFTHLEKESNHRRSLELSESEHRKKITEQDLKNRRELSDKMIDTQVREQKFNHKVVFVSLFIGVLVVILSNFIVMNKIATIGIYILIATLNISPSKHLLSSVFARFSSEKK